MCRLVTVVLPEAANLDTASVVFERHGMGFKRVESPHVLDQLAPRDTVILTTRASNGLLCDCTTPLGSQSRPLSHTTGDDGKVSKLRKQGWGEAKILRWRQQKEQEDDKERRVCDAKAENALPQLRRWMTFISNLLESGCTERLGLLLLWSNVQDDRRRVLRQERLPLSTLTPEQLLYLAEDVVYHCHR